MSSLISSLFFSDKPLDTGLCFHTKYKIIYLTDGSAKVVLNDRIVVMEKNDILFLSDNDYCSFQTVQQPCRRYVLILAPQEFTNEFKEIPVKILFKFRPQLGRGCIRIPNPAEVTALFEKMLAEHGNSDHVYSDTMIRLYLRELFIWSYRASRGMYFEQGESTLRKLLQAQTITENNYNRPILIGDLCRELQISLYYFTHQFSAFVGCGPKQYLTKIRLNQAGLLLQNSTHNISEISDLTGFSDTNNFIRSFKKAFRITPTKVRDLSRKRKFLPDEPPKS